MLNEAPTEGNKWINPAVALPDPAPNLCHAVISNGFSCGESTKSPHLRYRAHFDMLLPAPNIHSRSCNRYPPFVLWSSIHRYITVESIKQWDSCTIPSRTDRILPCKKPDPTADHEWGDLLTLNGYEEPGVTKPSKAWDLDDQWHNPDVSLPQPAPSISNFGTP